ncbi:MAG TPA: hypothetical protein VGC42_10930, partial [Kofleriaceae bacterium]
MDFDELDRLLAAAPAAQGVLAVATERGPRTYLLGPRTQLDAHLLDWRTAPLAEAFFRYRPGDRYAVEVGARTAEGRVLERWVIERHGRGLVGEDRRLARDGEQALPRPSP